MQGCLQKAFTQSPVEVAFALPQLSYVPPSSSESSGAQRGVRYAGGARVLLERCSILLASGTDACPHLHTSLWALGPHIAHLGACQSC